MDNATAIQLQEDLRTLLTKAKPEDIMNSDADTLKLVQNVLPDLPLDRAKNIASFLAASSALVAQQVGSCDNVVNGFMEQAKHNL